MKKFLCLILCFCLFCFCPCFAIKDKDAADVLKAEKKFWKNYKVEYDKFTGTTKYYNKSYFSLNTKGIIVKKNDDIIFYLSFHLPYLSHQWLTVQSITINYDEIGNYKINSLVDRGYQVVNCDPLLGCDFSENFIYNVPKDEIEILRKIANASSTEICAYGLHRAKNFRFTAMDRRALNEMLMLYDRLNKVMQ